jgi:hypothetical protein
MTTKPDFHEDFSYSKGPIHTTVPWERPNMEKFSLWWKSFLPSLEKTPFYAWLCGGFLEGKPDTWDIDIILTKRTDLEPNQYKQLSDLMIEATRLSLDNYNILVDIQFYENFPGKDVAVDGVMSFWYSTEGYLKKGSIDSIKWVAFDSVYKNGSKMVDYRDADSRAIEILPLLWKVSVCTPSEKYVRRIEENNFVEPEPRLLFAPGEFAIQL